jgi:hypothetical protein
VIAFLIHKWCGGIYQCMMLFEEFLQSHVNLMPIRYIFLL